MGFDTPNGPILIRSSWTDTDALRSSTKHNMKFETLNSLNRHMNSVTDSRVENADAETCCQFKG